MPDKGPQVAAFWRVAFATAQMLMSAATMLLVVLMFTGKMARELLPRIGREPSVRQKVVCVGGGFSGALTAQLLEPWFDVTLIDTKSYFEFTPSVLRALAEPEKAAVISKPHLKYLKTAEFIHESVTHIQPHTLTLSNGDRIPFDYLLLATGASYHMPGRSRELMDMEWQSAHHMIKEEPECIVISSRIPWLSRYHERVRSSSSVLIVGAGTVGVELAAEIAEAFPNVAVTLLGPFMVRSPERCRRYCDQWMRRYGVTLLQDAKMTEQRGRRFSTSVGTDIEADIVFLCTGNVPNTEVLRRSDAFAGSLSARGFARAKSTLQLHGFEHVFVAGDVMETECEVGEKLCQNAIDEATIVATNIQRLSQRQPLKHYRPQHKPMLVSLGKFDCVFVYRGWSLCGFVPALMKEFVELFQMSAFHAASWHASVMRRKIERTEVHIV